MSLAYFVLVCHSVERRILVYCRHTFVAIYFVGCFFAFFLCVAVKPWPGKMWVENAVSSVFLRGAVFYSSGAWQECYA